MSSELPVDLDAPPSCSTPTKACATVQPPPLALLSDIPTAFARELHGVGVVGEDRLVKVLFLALSSRFLDRPVSIAIKGASSTGKSYVSERVLTYFPPDAYYSLSGMSEHALAYLNEPLSHRFLVVFEAAGMASDLASYLVRSLLSEGRVEYVTVVKTKNGMEPKTLSVEGPTGILTTTTAVRLHPENETRLLSLQPSDTQEQTRAVLRSLAHESDAPAAHVEDWQRLQRWLAAGVHRVAIPFAEDLAELVPPVAVRLRRDFATVLNLVRAHAILHQASRRRDERGHVIADLSDYAAVRELVADLVADEVGATVSTTVRETVAAVTELVADSDKAVTVKQLSERLGLDKSAALRRARVAIEKGYLCNLEERRGQPARLVVGEPLPGEQVVLPLPDDLSGCTVAVASAGVGRVDP